MIVTSFLAVFNECRKSKDTVVICDVLNISSVLGAIMATKILKRESIGIVTDVPMFLEDNNGKFKVKLNNWLIENFTSYVFLTEQMNELINKSRKPYIVIEGQVDINMKEVENTIEGKYPKKVCIYAGGLQKIYGIEMLVKGFLKANVDNSELHIYGNGDFEEELKEICKDNPNIKYFGVMPNDYVVTEQLKATLLINPRPSNEEYTKYSFPSKNMEYMVSGTPVVTTRLPGMPKEYTGYVYLIEDESIGGISSILKEVLSKDTRIIFQKGATAKKFTLENKNNLIQAKKILDLVRKEKA